MHILIKKSHTAPRRIYHEPSDEDPTKPKCDIVGEFIRKDPDVMHGLRVCKECSGTQEPQEQGPKLSNKLERMNPEAI